MSGSFPVQERHWRLLLRLFLCSMLVVAFLLTLLKLHRQLFLTPGFALSDWLIPYSGQFVRRGLGGELLWLVESGLHVPMVSVVALISGACYLLFMLTSMRLVMILSGLPVWLLIVSPATAFFPAFEAEAVARKEILLLAIPALLLWRKQGSAPMLPVQALLLVALTLLLFIHEGMIFFMPLLGVFIWHAWGDTRPVRQFLFISAVWLTLVAAVIAGLNHVYPANPAELCQVLAQRNSLPAHCAEPLQTAVSWLAVAPTEVWTLAAGKFDAGRLLSIGFGLVLCAMPFIGLRNCFRGDRAIILALLATLPLFMMTLDWGRWLHVIAMLLLAIYAAKTSPAQAAGAVVFPRSLYTLLAAAIMILMWVGSWQLVHCCMLVAEPGALSYLMRWIE